MKLKKKIAAANMIWAFSMLIVINTISAQQSANSFRSVQKQKINYWLHLPADYNKKLKEGYPLILFLHGSGESGSDINKVKIWGLPKYIETHPDFPAIVISPQCPDARVGWNRFVLRDLLLEIRHKLNVDTNRVYVTGMSMGGRGTWDLITYYPEMFAAAIPVCGWGDDRLIRRSKNVAVRIYHGADDDVVDANYSRIMYDAMKKTDANVELTIFPNVKHDAWNKVYNDSTVYEWLLKQKKK